MSDKDWKYPLIESPFERVSPFGPIADMLLLVLLVIVVSAIITWVIVP